jgi:hypothetical protein
MVIPDSEQKMSRVPKTLHYIFGMASDFGGKPWSLVHHVCLKSAVERIAPQNTLFHYEHEPKGPWWELSRELVTPVRIEAPREIFGRPLDHVAHRADVVRLQTLIEHGGIYLDADVSFIAASMTSSITKPCWEKRECTRIGDWRMRSSWPNLARRFYAVGWTSIAPFVARSGTNILSSYRKNSRVSIRPKLRFSRQTPFFGRCGPKTISNGFSHRTGRLLSIKAMPIIYGRQLPGRSTWKISRPAAFVRSTRIFMSGRDL